MNRENDASESKEGSEKFVTPSTKKNSSYEANLMVQIKKIVTSNLASIDNFSKNDVLVLLRFGNWEFVTECVENAGSAATWVFAEDNSDKLKFSPSISDEKILQVVVKDSNNTFRGDIVIGKVDLNLDKYLTLNKGSEFIINADIMDAKANRRGSVSLVLKLVECGPKLDDGIASDTKVVTSLDMKSDGSKRTEMKESGNLKLKPIDFSTPSKDQSKGILNRNTPGFTPSKISIVNTNTKQLTKAQKREQTKMLREKINAYIIQTCVRKFLYRRRKLKFFLQEEEHRNQRKPIVDNETKNVVEPIEEEVRNIKSPRPENGDDNAEEEKLEAFERIPFENLKRVQFFVDGSDGLPCACTMSRVVGKLFNSDDRKQIGEFSESYSDPESLATAPNFNLFMTWQGT
jgi:hypothetical protein